MNYSDLKDYEIVRTPKSIIRRFLKAETNLNSGEIRGTLKREGYTKKAAASRGLIYDIDRFNLPAEVKTLPKEEQSEITQQICFFWNQIRQEISRVLAENQPHCLTLKQAIFPTPLPSKAKDDTPKDQSTTPWSAINKSDDLCKINHLNQPPEFGLGIDIAKKLAHPNLVPETVVQISTGEIITIAPNLSKFPTLHQMTIVGPYRKIGFIIDAMQGNLYMHQNKKAHCDIKPGNIMIVEDVGQLCDLESIVHFEHDEIPNVVTPMFCEYFYYQHSERQYNPKSDVFSWGITILSSFCPLLRPDREIKVRKGPQSWNSNDSFNYLCELIDQQKTLHPRIATLIKSMIQIDPNKRPELAAVIVELTDIRQEFEIKTNFKGDGFRGIFG